MIDEAQYIKNHGTQAARAVKQVQTGFRLALTGTPIENRLSELWSIFDYLMPGYLYSYQRFRIELEQPIVQHKDEDAAKRLQRLIRPFVLRRLKKKYCRICRTSWRKTCMPIWMGSSRSCMMPMSDV